MIVPPLLRLFGPALAASAVLGVATALPAKPISASGLAGAPHVANTSTSATELSAEENHGAAQFETVPSPLPGNVDALVFGATGTAEFGDLVRLDGSAHFIGNVVVTMSSGARRSDFPDNSALGFTHPVTLTLYAVDRSGGDVRPGEALARITDSFLIPWRSEPPTGAPLPGRAFTLTFDFARLGTALPDEVIFGISFDTQFFGAKPTTRLGPADFLGVGVTERTPKVGVDVQSDAVFWRTSGPFQKDTGWTPFRPAVRFTSSLFGVLFDTVARLEALRGPDRNAATALGVAASLTALALDRTLWDGNAQLKPVHGRYVFDLLAEAADELTVAAKGQGTPALEAQRALETIRTTAGLLAEIAVADAIIFGGDAAGIGRAHSASDDATAALSRARIGDAIDLFGEAWQEAHSALK